MAEEDGTEPGVLESDEARKLANEGRDVWNKWAAENEGVTVSFIAKNWAPNWSNGQNSESFSGFIFPGQLIFTGNVAGKISFEGAEFRGPAKFDDTVFEKEVHFDYATFGDAVSFIDCDFQRRAGFTDSIFERSVNFSGSHFRGALNLDGATFVQPPDLRRTQIASHITLHRVQVGYETALKWLRFREVTDPEAADKFRRLKQLSIDAKDHSKKLTFLAGEYRAKRFHETTSFGGLALNYLYDWLSNFGSSAKRPAVGIIATWLIMVPAYAALTTTSGAWYTKLADGMTFSAANLLPFLSGSRITLSQGKTTLYANELPVTVQALSIIEGLLAAVFIFLIGLALRNRFRL